MFTSAGNGEKLRNTLEQLAGKNGEMTVKMQKLRSLASYVGAIPNPTGKQKFTRQQRTRAYDMLETNAEFENIPGKTGKEKFENLKNTESIMKSVFGSEVGEGARSISMHTSMVTLVLSKMRRCSTSYSDSMRILYSINRRVV